MRRTRRRNSTRSSGSATSAASTIAWNSPNSSSNPTCRCNHSHRLDLDLEPVMQRAGRHDGAAGPALAGPLHVNRVELGPVRDVVDVDTNLHKAVEAAAS